MWKKCRINRLHTNVGITAATFAGLAGFHAATFPRYSSSYNWFDDAEGTFHIGYQLPVKRFIEGVEDFKMNGSSKFEGIITRYDLSWSSPAAFCKTLLDPKVSTIEIDLEERPHDNQGDRDYDKKVDEALERIEKFTK